MAILLKNATFVDWQTLDFKSTNILVEEGIDGKIQFVRNSEQVEKNKIKQTIDCTGKMVTKSFAVGHHHVYSALAKGMPAPKKSPENFYEILQYIWWNIDKCLDKEMIEFSAYATAIACAKAGATFAIDHHASPNFIKGSLNVIADAFEKVGVNHLLCYEITDRDGLDKAQQGLDETEDYLKKRQGLVGLHASFTVGDDTLKKAVELARKYDSGLHVHAAEDLYDQTFTLEKYGKRVVERFLEAGVLSLSKTILVHCLHLDALEREFIKKSVCWVVENMESNLNNNVGYFSGKGLGEKIMLGTDGMHSDMLQSAKAAFFVGQRHDIIDYPSSYKRFRNVHHYLNSNGFKGDGDNNLVILDYKTATEINQNNFLGHFIFGLNSNHVNDVISNGKLVVKDRKIMMVDEVAILVEAQKHGKRLWRKL
ncbi:MAG: amidohydrolase family protein [Bacteroidetes bacterium]|nr:amidohydrolase family protein [Bacteroidota bacterium]